MGSVAEIAKFLGKDLDEDNVRKIVAKCDFDKMSKNPLVNGENDARFDFKISRFLRKGKEHYRGRRFNILVERVAIHPYEKL